MALPQDHLARSSALDPRRSFAVTAPAGSGKTELLTQRVLKLLGSCERPEEILCITFTRKAAGEMQARIIAALQLAQDTEPPLEAHQQQTWQLARAALAQDQILQWDLLSSPNRLKIMTIDGLCANLTKHLPVAANFGAQPQIVETYDDCYQVAIQNTLDLLESTSHYADDISILLRHLDNDLNRVALFLKSLVLRRDQWIEYVFASRDAKQALEHAIQSLIVEELQSLHAALYPLSAELIKLVGYAAENLQREASDSIILEALHLTALPNCTAEHLNQWLAILEILITKDKDAGWRQKIDKRQGFPAGSKKDEKAIAAEYKQLHAEVIDQLSRNEQLLQQMQIVRRLPPPHYLPQQWQLLNALTRLLPVLIAQLTLTFRERGCADYTAITSGALQALGDSEAPTDIALALDYRIRHILVDEFQDTSTPQLRLLEKLTAGWENNDGRTLFIVGDGMQSCYGFRDANVGIFLDAQDHGIGAVQLENLELTVNFRSQSGIIDWVNATFQQAFPAQRDVTRGAVSYSPSIAFNPAIPGKAVESFAFLDQADRQAEAKKVVALVLQSQAEAAEDSIAILVRSRPQLSEILPALTAAGLTWQATDIDPLAARMVITDLLSLTKAFLNPADRISWLAILRAPWCGLDQQDLWLVANWGAYNEEDGADATIPIRSRRLNNVIWEQLRQYKAMIGLSTAGVNALQRLVNVLEPAWQQRLRKSLRQTIEGIWFALGGPAAVADPNDLIDVPTFFNTLERFDQAGELENVAMLEQAIGKLYAAPRPDGNPKLQVMTIHKSKGLEFDTVIMPSLDKTTAANDKQLLIWQERISHQGEKQLLMSPLTKTGEDDDLLYKFIHEENQQKFLLENNRLLYVGVTRAIKKLYLLANIKTTAKGEIATPAKNSLLAPIWSAVANQLSVANADRAEMGSAEEFIQTQLFEEWENQDDKKNTGLNHLLRLPEDWLLPELPRDNLLQQYHGEDFDFVEDNMPVLNHTPWLKHTGTVIHRTLKQIVVDGLSNWTPQKIAQQKSFWQNQLQQLGVHNEFLKNAMSRIETAITHILQDAKGQWMLSNTLPASACELELSYVHNGEIRHIVIDRTFIDGNKRWIIDYKTSEPDAGQSLVNFLVQEAALYRGQLQRYAGAFQAMEGGAVAAALYFPLLGELYEVEV